jgi:hypothetical protein
MAKLSLGLIAYGVMPGIMVVMLLAAILVAIRSDSTQRTSAFAGVAGGVIVFGLYFFKTFQGTDVAPQAGLARLVDASWFPALGGFVVGFAMLWCVQATRLRTGLRGLLTLFLTSTSSIALYGYFFDSPVRDVAVLFAYGSMLGIILYVILYGQRLRELLHKPVRTI